MDFTEKVKQALVVGGLSMSELARRARMNISTVTHIVRRRTDPTLSNGARLAGALGLSLDWLTDDSADWPPPQTPEQSAEAMVRDALTAGAGLGGLSAQERRLLAGFRALDGESRGRLLGYAEGLVATTATEAAEGGATGETSTVEGVPLVGGVAQARHGAKKRRRGA